MNLLAKRPAYQKHLFISIVILSLSAGAMAEDDVLDPPGKAPDADIDESVVRMENVSLSTPVASLEIGAAMSLGQGKGSSDKPGVEFITLPVPLSNPTIGSGLALGTMLLYQLDSNSPASSTTFGGLYTDSGTWGAGFSQKTHFNNDRYRLDIFAGYADANLTFYGIGRNSGNAGLPINQSGSLFKSVFKVEAASDFYVGLGYKYLSLSTSIDPADIFPGTSLPVIGLDTVLSGLILELEYDTRDHTFNPGRGKLAQFQGSFYDKRIGSDLTYQKYELAYNHYHRLWGGVLAGRATLCGTEGRVPFFDLCLFGSSNSLRGYEIGRFRDRRMFTAQLEYRRNLVGPFGVVLFAGVGKVARSMSDMNSSDLLSSAGIGLRYMASEKNKVNVSIDYAAGKESDAIYFYIGEAF